MPADPTPCAAPCPHATVPPFRAVQAGSLDTLASADTEHRLMKWVGEAGRFVVRRWHMHGVTVIETDTVDTNTPG